MEALYEMNDLAISSMAGLGLAVGLIVVLNMYPGEPFDYKSAVDGDMGLGDDINEEEKAKAEETVVKSKKLQKILGMSGEQLKEALEKAKKDPPPPDTYFNACKLIEYIVYILLFGIAFFILNIITNGDLGRMVVGMFPVEMESLGIKDQLNSLTYQGRGSISMNIPGAVTQIVANGDGNQFDSDEL